MFLRSRSESLNLIGKSQQLEAGDEVDSTKSKILLHPIAMRIPNEHCVYSPSRLDQIKAVTYQEFLAKYANHPRAIRVCFDDYPSSTSILENSELITAYGFGMDCWYIIAEDRY